MLCPEMERLERGELTIDVAEKDRKVALADAEALRVTRTIQRENALRELLAKKIKRSLPPPPGRPSRRRRRGC